jgi:hypothetical protein
MKPAIQVRCACLASSARTTTVAASQAIMVADGLSDGIANQFPARV